MHDIRKIIDMDKNLLKIHELHDICIKVMEINKKKKKNLRKTKYPIFLKFI